jgi:hypothetical protein
VGSDGLRFHHATDPRCRGRHDQQDWRDESKSAPHHVIARLDVLGDEIDREHRDALHDHLHLHDAT